MFTALDKVTALVLIDLQNGIVGGSAPGALQVVTTNAKKLMLGETGDTDDILARLA